MLVLAMNEGDYISIGDNIRIHFDRKVGQDTLSLGVEAPDDVTILRGKLYEADVARKAAAGDGEALVLAGEIKKDRAERRRRAFKRKAWQEKRERRLAGDVPVISSVGSG